MACSGSGSAGSISSGPLLRTLLTSRDTSRISMRSRSPWPRSSPSSIGASGSSQRSQSACADRQRHPVVDLGQRSCRIGGDDGAAQQRRAVLRRTLRPPRRPQPGHEQQLAVGCRTCRTASSLPFSPRHSYQPSIGTRHRLPLAELRNAGEVVTFSARALISSGPLVSGTPSSACLHPWRNQPPAHPPHPPRRLVVGLAVPLDHGADGGGRRDVVVGAAGVLPFGGRVLSSMALIFSASSAGSVVTANRPHM